MEGIVSLFVLSILLVTITTMLQAAVKLTDKSNELAEKQRDLLNSVISSNYSESKSAEIYFSDSAGVISANHDITLNTTEGIIAFTP